MLAFHVSGSGFNNWLLFPASADLGTTLVAQVIGFIPYMWEVAIVFLASDFVPSPTAAFTGI